MIRIAAAALALALPVAAAAQGHEGEGMQHRMHDGMEHHPMMQEGMHGPMMHGGMAMMTAGPGPGMLLRLRSTLELSADQVERLEALRTEAHEAMRTHSEAAGAARERAHAAVTGESADLDAFEAALEEAAGHHVQAMVAMARAHTEAGRVLTDGQRATLETVMDAMHEMRGGMSEGMEAETESEHEGMRHTGG